MYITLEGDTLAVVLPDLDAAGISYGAELEPYLPDVYILRVAGNPYDLTFLEDVEEPDGPSRWARNRSFVLERAETGLLLPHPTHPVTGPDPRYVFRPTFGMPRLP